MEEMEPLIEVRALHYAYPDAPQVPVLRDMNLSVQEGECLAILGESGSGKSTLLKLMCGLLQPDSGEIIYRGKSLAEPGSEIAMLFQNYGLFPWKTVRSNIVLPLQLRHEKIDREKIDRLLDYLGLAHHADKYPGELSGGQQQRTALGRAVVSHAKLILMDEPFSALDIRNREKLQVFMKKFFRDTEMTSVIVTHSIEEALAMGSRIAVFDPEKGCLLKIIDNSSHPVAGTEDYYKRIRSLRTLMGLEESA